MKCKIAAMAGAIIGWGGAGLLIIIGTTRQHVLAQAFLIGVGIAGTAWLMLCAWKRPVAETFDYAYRLGRQDERRELVGPDGGGTVVPMRRLSVPVECDASRAVDA